jgi:hypothetical protein
MAHELIFVPLIHGWGCSDCTWVFVPSGLPHGDTIDGMKGNFEAKREKEFKSHVCIEPSENEN